MDSGLKVNIESLIKSKRGFEFEALIREMHLIQHGADGYQPTRERGDQGAEGLIVSTKTITAAYGPDAYDKKEFTKKINDDFDDYLNNWANVNDKWVMYYNGALAPDQIKIADTLHVKAKDRTITVNSILVKGIDQTMQMIQEEFSNKQIRQLATYLGVSKELIVFDNLRSLIDDLIRDVGINPNNIEYNLEIYIEDKIKLNFNQKEVEGITSEYETLVEEGTLKKISSIISTFQTEEITSLKLRVVTDFGNQNGTFKEKLTSLTNLYYNKYSSGNDDDFFCYIRGILIYCFEQCIIGQKTKEEKERNKS